MTAVNNTFTAEALRRSPNLKQMLQMPAEFAGHEDRAVPAGIMMRGHSHFVSWQSTDDAAIPFHPIPPQSNPPTPPRPTPLHPAYLDIECKCTKAHGACIRPSAYHLQSIIDEGVESISLGYIRCGIVLQPLPKLLQQELHQQIISHTNELCSIQA